MGVAAARAVALWDEQHVLTERRQVAAAQRTPVSGRLAVLCATDRPPAGFCEVTAGHRLRIAAGPVSSCAAMEHVEERIIVETVRYRITGVLRLPRDGYRSRLTDYLNSSERAFIALTDVEVASLERGSVERHPFLALSLHHVVLAMPADDA
jgi:hypothetical protein